eukprot:COSAG02_NODE_26718_length_626_cov_1.136622_1_plen_49_part_01
MRGQCAAPIPVPGWQGELGKTGSGSDPKPPPGDQPHVGPIPESDCAAAR